MKIEWFHVGLIDNYALCQLLNAYGIEEEEEDQSWFCETLYPREYPSLRIVNK